MKTIKRLSALLFAAVCVILCALVTLLPLGTTKAYAASNNAYRFTITQYDVDYTINTDRTMQVVEYTTIRYEGYSSTGHYHVLPVNAGDRVRNLKVSEIIGGKESHVDYSVTDEFEGYIAADIGDYSNKTGETHTYKLTYEYAITKPKNKNAIYLNAIGFGWDCEIEKANITLHLPEGFKTDSSKYYVGQYDEEGTSVAGVCNGNVISLSVDDLAEYNGVTFDLFFNDGVLGTKIVIAPYLIALGALVLGLAALAIVKLLWFNNDGVAPVINLEAPDAMDPLEMGKLVDNKVDQSDVTSLIYYWANLGYLKIDLTDPEDVTLIRIWTQLPPSAPEHQRLMYEKLFEYGEAVKVSSLKDSFYKTVEAVTKKVNGEHGALYTKKSLVVAGIFTFLGAAIMALTPVLYCMFTLSFKLINALSLVAFIPAFVVFFLMLPVKYSRFKRKKKAKFLSIAGVVGLCIVFTLMYVLIVPSYVLEVGAKICLCVAGFAVMIPSVTIVSRTDEYTEKLNHILGFKDFIASVEKEKLELLIEETPELYYKILPYAQVLGVSDVWEDKFKSIEINAPSWAVGYNTSVFDIMLFNSLMRSMNANMALNMNSRPQPSSGGLSGGGFGHFGGGGGFGHGGGGGFGR